MCCEKDLSYEEAKQLCQMAFDAGADYGSTSVQFNCNAVAYDWEHWLKKNEGLFRPKPTVEDVLQKLLEQAVGYSDAHTTVALDAIAEYAQRLRLREVDE